MWCAVAIIANAARRDNSKFFMMKSLWSSKVLENASCASMAWNFERILAPHPCSQNKSVTERLNSAMLTSTVSNWCSTVTDCSMEDIVSSSPNARNWFRIECQFLPAAFFTMYLSITCGWRSSRRRADEQSRMCIYILCDRTTMKPNCSISQVCDERQPKLSQVQLG